MTIEQLLECSADKLEAMSDEELKRHFEQYLPHTRPNLVQARMAQEPAKKIASRHRFNGAKEDKMEEARRILRALGKDVRF